MEDYSYPVHRSLFKRKMIMGIPTVPFVIISMFTIIILMDFKAIAIIPVGVGLLWVTREISKKDPYLLDIILNSLSDPKVIN